ncbi:MAG: hypothetical protein Q8R20_00175 [Nanoarchaeota archaeon]|nr:hypothetical protein [Nanoarchaeota archaeon]
MNESKNGNGIDYLIRLNEAHSSEFVSPEMTLARRQYRAKHPTEIGVLKCMDGRLHLPVMTNTALGIIQPWRNLGGRFDLGWYGFALSIKGWVDYAIGRGRDVLIIVTYHFAKGNSHRGCRGFNYDVEAAKAFTSRLKKQFDRVFGKGTVYAIQCGIETDSDALILHGEHGEIADLSLLEDFSEPRLEQLIRELYPDMPEAIAKDLLPLACGNVNHVAEVKDSNRPIADVEHKEWVLALGRGFDWLHLINTGLIVGPFDPDFAGAIEKATLILESNLKEGRIDEKSGVVLMTSAPYREASGPEPRLAEEKTRFLMDFALGVIETRVPKLISHISRVSTTVDMNTRRLQLIERFDKK